jgi:hypothetical protein
MRPSSLSFTSEPTLHALAGRCVWRPWLGSLGIRVREAFAGGPRGASRRSTTSGVPGCRERRCHQSPDSATAGPREEPRPMTHRSPIARRSGSGAGGREGARRRDRRLAGSRWYNSEVSKRCSRWRGSGSVPVACQTEVAKAHGRQRNVKTFLL